MAKMSLRVLCGSVSKKRRTVYGTVRIGVVLPTTEFADNAARVLIYILGKCVIPLLNTAAADTALNGYSHGFTADPVGCRTVY